MVGFVAAFLVVWGLAFVLVFVAVVDAFVLVLFGALAAACLLLGAVVFLGVLAGLAVA